MTEYKTFKDLKFKFNPITKGLGALSFFQNGYGVSVVDGPLGTLLFASSNDDSNWELAILQGTPGNWKISYSTYITENVIGHLNEEEVTEIMKQVQDLEKDEEK